MKSVKNFASKNFADGRFYNLDRSGNKISEPKSIWDILKWKLGRKRDAKWPKFVDTGKYDPPSARSKKLQLTCIGHCTFLIQANDVNIITDPVFAKRASPSQLFGPKRVHQPGLAINQLPKIDYLVISHNHYDHMDLAAVKKICKRDNPLVLVGLKNSRYLKGITNNIYEMNWNDVYKTSDDLEIHFLRCRHWSRRTLSDTNETLWGAFAFRIKKHKIYFAGDSGYSDHFSEAGTRFKGFDLALLGIGSYEPRWFMKSAHINPEEAVLASQELKAKLVIPMHYRTFQISAEGIDEPIRELRASLDRHQLSQNTFYEMDIGEVRKF